MTNVVQAIAAVMGELPAISKDQRSEQGYKYRGIEQITAHIQALCAKHQVVVVPHVKSRTTKELLINSRPWTEEQLEVTYTVYGPGGPGDKIEVGPLWGLGRDNSDKGANKAETQAFKYCLLELFQIGDSEADSDREPAHEADARQAPARTNGNGHAMAKKAAPTTPAEPPLKPGEVSAASAKRTLLAAFAAQGIGPGAAEMCAKEVWGDRGHSPIAKAELDKLIAELEPTRPKRTITEGTNNAGVQAAKAALVGAEGAEQ